MKALAYLTPAFIRSHHTCENHRGVSMVYAKDPAIFQAQVPPLDVAQLMKALAQPLPLESKARSRRSSLVLPAARHAP
jgi:hypothetical protein